MTIGSGVPYNSHTGNGVTRTFAYGFTLLDAGDLTVTVAGAATSAYTISGIGNAGGGSITFAVAPANGAAVLIRRVIDLVRTTDYQTNGDLQADTVNLDFDRLWTALQQVSDASSRAVRVPIPETLTELGAASARLDKLPYFTSSTGALALSSFTHTQLASAVAAAYAAGSTADAVTFVADGTGAVSRTSQSKMRDVVDVADFGVEPGTGTSQSAKIASAVAACAGGKVLRFSKPGMYTVDATVLDAAIVLPVGVDLEMAPGAWLTATTSFGSFVAPLGRNRIKVNIDGGGYPTTGGVTGTWGIENVGIRCYFDASIGRGATDVIVEGSRIKNVSYAIQTEGAQRWTVTGNRMERCKLSAMLMGYLNGFDCVGNLIYGNQFDDLGDYATAFYQVGVSLGYGAFNVIAFNRAKNCNQRTNGYAFGVEQGEVERQHHFSFVGNSYETDGSVTVSVGGITVSTCSHTLVANNVLTCPVTTQAVGINCVQGKHNTIQSNVLDGWRECAISTDGSDGVDLIGNTIFNCGDTSPARPAIRMAYTRSTSNIRLMGGSITIDSAYAYSGSTVAAVLALAATGKTVKNIDVVGTVLVNPNDRAISVEGTSAIPITNVNVRDITVTGIGSSTFFTREVVYCSYVNDLTVEGLVAMDAKRGLAAVNCDGVTWARNEFKGSVTITTLYDITGSSNLRIRDDIVTAPVTTAVTPSARMLTNGNSARGCTSIVTEAAGTTGAIASGATVTHGMSAAPTQVALTPISAAVACAVTARSSTTFTVTFTGGGTQTFDWQAAIR